MNSEDGCGAASCPCASSALFGVVCCTSEFWLHIQPFQDRVIQTHVSWTGPWPACAATDTFSGHS